MKSPYEEKVRTCQDSTYKTITHKFNDKHSATHHKVDIGDKVILKRHERLQTNLQSY